MASTHFTHQIELAKHALALSDEIALEGDRQLTLLYAIRDRIAEAFKETDSSSAHAALNLIEILADLMGDAESQLMLRGMLETLSKEVAA